MIFRRITTTLLVICIGVLAIANITDTDNPTLEDVASSLEPTDYASEGDIKFFREHIGERKDGTTYRLLFEQEGITKRFKCSQEKCFGVEYKGTIYYHPENWELAPDTLEYGSSRTFWPNGGGFLIDPETSLYGLHEGFEKNIVTATCNNQLGCLSNSHDPGMFSDDDFVVVEAE